MLDQTGSQAVQHTFNTDVSDRSCPYLRGGLWGEADLSPKATSKGPWIGWRGMGCHAGPHGCCFPGFWELGGWDWS
ncbi:hypothetical protein D4764_11G0004400 [Takifugu flavidus]|uniref:Uncharacterized protein n=1 Tax=Takifugu flavidus TaxID=433684 RepID=A0A5C6PHD5_9TELE|nr:hypothetical protein D4764_11G0004400 [Takifugu flavidus]